MFAIDRATMSFGGLMVGKEVGGVWGGTRFVLGPPVQKPKQKESQLEVQSAAALLMRF